MSDHRELKVFHQVVFLAKKAQTTNRKKDSRLHAMILRYRSCRTRRQGRTQKFVERGCENAFLQISWDSRGKDLFLEINILSPVLRDLFTIVSSTITENNILHFSKERARA